MNYFDSDCSKLYAFIENSDWEAEAIDFEGYFKVISHYNSKIVLKGILANTSLIGNCNSSLLYSQGFSIVPSQINNNGFFQLENSGWITMDLIDE